MTDVISILSITTEKKQTNFFSMEIYLNIGVEYTQFLVIVLPGKLFVTVQASKHIVQYSFVRNTHT